MARKIIRKKSNARDIQRANATAAMPEVKKLVHRFGRVAVSNCIGKIKERDKEAARLAALKKQVADLEKGLR